MKQQKIVSLIVSLLIIFSVAYQCSKSIKVVERPEKIFSKRLINYDTETYTKLANLWKQYYDVFPSEDAYANWMYAARYAGDTGYEKLLEKGLNSYPANPTLLYLKGLLNHGLHDNLEAQHLLEKAAELDPSYMDPWYGLVTIYMDANEEMVDAALRHILESGIIPDEIMDYSYNMLVCLEKDAILITNGDNDTFPGWILTRLLNHRPDVTIVNRSLLNTDWYPLYIIEKGLPRFITQNELDEFHERTLKEIKDSKTSIPSSGPFGDKLIEKIINAANRENLPVYFSATLYSTEMTDKYKETGHDLGFVNLVNPRDRQYSLLVKNFVNSILIDFRTGGLDGWRLRNSKEAGSGRRLMLNYAAGIYKLMESIIEYTPERRLELFHWHQEHLVGVIPQNFTDEINKMWCLSKDIDEINTWCFQQGYVE